MAQRIFMIEDDSALREELAHLLELAGFMPIGITERFEEAPQKALEANVDCVVVDLNFPTLTVMRSAARYARKATCRLSYLPPQRASSMR